MIMIIRGGGGPAKATQINNMINKGGGGGPGPLLRQPRIKPGGTATYFTVLFDLFSDGAPVACCVSTDLPP